MKKISLGLGAFTLSASLMMSPVFAQEATHTISLPYHTTTYESSNSLTNQNGNEGIFSPNQFVTRADFISMLVDSLGLSDTGETVLFSDVSTHAPYYESLKIAAQHGLVKGISFQHGYLSAKPTTHISHAEMVVMTIRALASKSSFVSLNKEDATNLLLSHTNTANLPSWATTSFAEALHNNLISDDFLNQTEVLDYGTYLDSSQLTNKAKALTSSTGETITLPNGYLYKGQVNDKNEPNGVGTLYYPPTNDERNVSSVGQFQDGVANGFQTVYNEEGVVTYKGNVENNVPSGYGVLYNTKTGHVSYEGFFKNDKFDGYGTAYDDNGLLFYKGTFKDNQFDGKGILYFESGKPQYIGYFSKNAFEGYGVMFYEDGETILYKGEWSNDLFNGQGKLYNVDTDIWNEGSFVDGVYQN